MDCPICKLSGRYVTTVAVGDRYEIDCARCGKYSISGTAYAMSLTRPANFALSSWLRNTADVSGPAQVSSATLEHGVATGKAVSVSGKQLRLMRALEARSTTAGKKVHLIPEFDFTLASCSSDEELEFILRALIERGLLTLADYKDPAESFSLEVMITPAGWDYLERHMADTEVDAVNRNLPQAGAGQWDVFISHASEDKAEFATPLAEALRSKGLRVWFDEFTLTIGDSLRQSIDRGLSQSRFGVVVLSDAFFQKRWPKLELDGLFAREAQGSKVMLPIWHGLDEQGVRAHSPLLADRVAISSEHGVAKVAEAILAAMRTS